MCLQPIKFRTASLPRLGKPQILHSDHLVNPPLLMLFRWLSTRTTTCQSVCWLFQLFSSKTRPSKRRFVTTTNHAVPRGDVLLSRGAKSFATHVHQQLNRSTWPERLTLILFHILMDTVLLKIMDVQDLWIIECEGIKDSLFQ